MEEQKTSHRWFFILIVLLGASSYGIVSPLIKLAYEDGWNEIQVTGSQITMGAAVLWIIVCCQPKAWSNPFRGPWIKLSLIGIFGLSLTTLLYNMTLSYMDASLSIILLFQFTWITVVMESVLLRKRPTLFQLLAIAIILSGTLLAVGLKFDHLSTLNATGIILGLLSACTYSVFLTLTGRVRTSFDAVLKSAIMVTSAIPLIYILYPPQYLFHTGVGSLIVWGTVLGLFGQVFPTLFFNIGIPRIGSSLTAILGAIELPVAIIGAFLLLHETILPLQWAGMAIILSGIIVAEKKAG